MAEILGYKASPSVNEALATWLTETIGDIFPNISYSTTSGNLIIDILDEENNGFRIKPYSSDYLAPTLGYITSSGKMSSSVNLKATERHTVAGSIRIYKTSTGIMMTIGGHYNPFYSNYISSMAYNIEKKSAAIMGNVYEAEGSNGGEDKVVTPTIYTGLNGTIANSSLATHANQATGFVNSPYPVLTELACNNQHTGIYFLTQGRVINGAVTDGSKNIFVSWLLGLED